jgi:hypothetical protein
MLLPQSLEYSAMQLVPANVTTLGGWYERFNGTNYTGGTYQRDSFDRTLSNVLARPGYRRTAAIMRALNGVAPGAAYSVTKYRIAAPTAAASMFGGTRTVEAVVQSGTTTTAMRDEINGRVYDDVAKVMQPSAYPVDLSGNGGAGKVGF